MSMCRLIRVTSLLIVIVSIVAGAACATKKKSVARPLPPPPPPPAAPAPTAVPRPPEPAREPVGVPAEPVRDDAIRSASLDELNRNSPLRPVFFEYDSSEITTEGRSVLDSNATVLKGNAGWTITIEGHCDERGTAEYNLALGERRAVAARAYLLSLGIPADRLRTVSYGKEFPFDPGHDESAYAKNRRAHFVITAK
jgi:peptidoglycan-associated lipoprotein